MQRYANGTPVKSLAASDVTTARGSENLVTNVWAHNINEEFEKLRKETERHRYIAIDTEFPGIVVRPTGHVREYYYQTIKCNIDLLKLIQLGLTLMDEFGENPKGCSTWQFNFKFDLETDIYAQDSIDYLQKNGIDFEKHHTHGIEMNDFAELLISSNLLMNYDIKWISFHGCYDLGYLIKMVTASPLPQFEDGFFKILNDFFPSFFDIKYILGKLDITPLNRSLSVQKLADHFDVSRKGQSNSAGCDSLLICLCFINLVRKYMSFFINDDEYCGVVYGLGCTLPLRPANSALLERGATLCNNLQNIRGSSHGIITQNEDLRQKVGTNEINSIVTRNGIANNQSSLGLHSTCNNVNNMHFKYYSVGSMAKPISQSKSSSGAISSFDNTTGNKGTSEETDVVTSNISGDFLLGNDKFNGKQLF